MIFPISFCPSGQCCFLNVLMILGIENYVAVPQQLQYQRQSLITKLQFCVFRTNNSST